MARGNLHTQAADRQRDHANRSRQSARRALRDIGPLPRTIDRKRRAAAKRDLLQFCRSYMPSVFYLPTSSDQKLCIEKTQQAILSGGMFALAMPRGSGKTAICRAAILWAALYGHRKFLFFIGSKSKKAEQSMHMVKSYLYGSLLLKEDFPEVCHPIEKLENRHHYAAGQLYHGKPTFVHWGTDTVRMPSIQLNAEDADYLKSCDAQSVIDGDACGIPHNAGVIMKAVGIDGSIRGDADVHPVTLAQVRPDCVILDDLQKDQRAASPEVCDQLITLIDGAVEGLSGPTESITCIMPCTVIRPGDVADTYLDREKKPRWQGERCRMVTRWPSGMDDHTIDPKSRAGKHWLRYAEIRADSYRRLGDATEANDYYQKNQKAMDRGFRCSWDARFERQRGEISAQQHAMNKRIDNPVTFAAEYQNNPQRHDEAAEPPIGAEALAQKTISTPRGSCPVGGLFLSAFVDVQDELLFYAVLASAPDFTATVIEYGTWPETGATDFSKHQAQSWALLTDAYRRRHRSTAAGAVPRDAKIRLALETCVGHLLRRTWPVDRGGGGRTIGKLGIDARWGKVTECVRRFCLEMGDPNIIPVFGEYVSPDRRQYEEYTPTEGWLFEHHMHPQVTESKWIYRPDARGLYYLKTDVNRLKTFLFERLAAPKGLAGTFTLHADRGDRHRMFTRHVCQSERPELIDGAGRSKEIWTPVDRIDNDYLDCLVGCCALASMQGSAIASSAPKAPTRRGGLRARWEAKRRKERRR